MFRRFLSFAAVVLAAVSFTACATPTAPKQPTNDCGAYQTGSDC